MSIEIRTRCIWLTRPFSGVTISIDPFFWAHIRNEGGVDGRRLFYRKFGVPFDEADRIVRGKGSL